MGGEAIVVDGGVGGVGGVGGAGVDRVLGRTAGAREQPKIYGIFYVAAQLFGAAKSYGKKISSNLFKCT